MENSYYIQLKTPQGVEFEIGFDQSNGKSMEQTIAMLNSFVEFYGVDIGIALITKTFREAMQEQGIGVVQDDGSIELKRE